MAYYLQMDGVDDRIATPSMTITQVILDVAPIKTSHNRRIWGLPFGAEFLQSNTNFTDTFSAGVTVYVNDVQKTSGTDFIASDTRQTIKIVAGSAKTNVNYIFSNNTSTIMGGKIYSVKFYNGASLVAHYDMTTQTVQDQSGNGNHATLTGGTWVDDGEGGEPTGTDGSITLGLTQRIYKSSMINIGLEQKIYKNAALSLGLRQDIYKQSIKTLSLRQDIYKSSSIVMRLEQDIHISGGAEVPNYTENIQLIKAVANDFIDFETHFNPNWDKIDEYITELADNLAQREINVRQPPYNLKGDGTDETSALQPLFDLAKDNGSVRLYFPKGTFGVKGTYGLRLYKNTTVRMHQETVIKRVGDRYKVFVNGEYGNDSYATGYTGEGNIHFVGGTIDLNSVDAPIPAANNISAFDLGHAENISFKDLTIKNGQNGHYFQLSSVKNVRFDNCWFGKVYHTNLGNLNYECIQIEEATAASFPSFGGYDQTITQDIFIEGCTFDTVVRAVGTHGFEADGGGLPLRYCKNIHITRNKFLNTVDSALNLMAYDQVTLLDNTFETVGGHGIYTSFVRDSVFGISKMKGVQKSALHLNKSVRNKFKDDDYNDVGKIGTYSAIRLVDSDDNTFADITLRSSTHTYAVYASDGSTGNRVRSHRFAAGSSGTIGGANQTEIDNITVTN